MRTTIDIESDVLAAAKELARQQNVAVGKVISNLVRDALASRSHDPEPSEFAVSGFGPFAVRRKVATNEDVEKLRDQEGV